MKRLALIVVMGTAGTAHAQTIDADFLDQKATTHVTGQQIFTHICQGCHMADGKGAVGAGHYPALAGNPRLATAAYPAVMVLTGRGAMPSFARDLTDAQVADVVNYVRGHLGNTYTDTLKPQDVERFRPPVPPTDEEN